MPRVGLPGLESRDSANGTLPALEGGEGRGVAEQWGVRGRSVSSCTVHCAVKYVETEAEDCSMDMKSDTLIRMVTLTNVDIRAGPGQSRAGHSSHNRARTRRFS